MVKRMKKVFPIVVNRNLFLHLRINIKDNSLVMINGKISHFEHFNQESQLNEVNTHNFEGSNLFEMRLKVFFLRKKILKLLMQSM